eukprot:5069053-Pleurochrysis_carterae.AAC.1
MSAYTGDNGPPAPKVGVQHIRLPFQSYVERKPEPLGAEIKNSACGLSGVIFFLEVMEGATAHAGQKFADEWSYTQALNLRLSESLHRSWRVWGADAYFTSADDVACMLIKVDTLASILTACCVVKRFATCVRGSSPSPLLPSSVACAGKAGHVGRHQGSHVALPRQADERALRRGSRRLVRHVHQARDGPSYLGGWASPRRRGAHAHQRPCPRVLDDWTQMQSAIDDANRRRQNILAFEERFVTRTFPFRLLTTVLGMIYMNAFNMHKYFVKGTARAAADEDEGTAGTSIGDDVR